MKLGIGKDAPEIVNAFIEIPTGSGIKYEYDKENDLMKVDRILFTSMVYPFSYGFIPGTKEEDGDPIDVLVLSNVPLSPGSYIEVRPIGMINMEDEKGVDKKIVAVPKDKVDPTYSMVKEPNDIPEATKKRIVHFFEHYKELEPEKWVKISGWSSASEAKDRIKKVRL
ncbi:MAG: inorganic diphosphatase [Candidatus Marsarchaeota archaeon]|nr:inorganic diphosphatase [Candidatus Marsarchaeota archaeon]